MSGLRSADANGVRSLGTSGLHSAVRRFDGLVDRGFDHLRGKPFVDRIFYTASDLGDWSKLWHVVGVARTLITPSTRSDMVALSAILGIESVVVNQGVKRLFRRDRPAFDGERPHRLRTPMTSSFPSGHASAAFCAAVVLSEQTPALRPVWYGAAAVVSASRVHVRIHHASDVLAGAVTGVAIGSAARAVLRAAG